jgi:signal transduction histidine kinase
MMLKQPLHMSSVFVHEPPPAGMAELPFSRQAPDGHQQPLSDVPVLQHVLVPVTVFAVSLLTIEAAHYSNLVATVWPANSIMLAILLCRAPSAVNFVSVIVGGAVATALASLVANGNPLLALAMMFGNGLEVATAVGLLAVFNIRASDLTSFNGALTFIFAAGCLAPIGSTFISAAAFGWAQGMPWHMVWRSWYPGHALGIIIVGPFLVSIMSSEWRRARIRQRLSEAVAVFLLFIAISVCVFYFRPVIFVLAPAILLATVRFGIVGASAATFFVAVIASVFVVLGIGQPIFLTQPELWQRILALQAFLAITSFWSLPTAALLTERDRLLRDLSRANRQLTADSENKSNLVTGLRRHLSMAEEKERLRLSHELHDQAGQSVVAVILELNEIDSLMSGPAHERLHLVRKQMEEMGKTLHRIAWELRPPSIDELGLRKALASYIAQWSEQCGTEVDFHCDAPKLDEVPNDIGTAVYRVVQEGLTNIVKHARRPSDVSVVISRPDTTLQVIIEDNGCGFDVGAQGANSGSQRGLGLDGMRERLALIGGTLEVESAIGSGTTIFARVALDGQRPAA